MDRNEITKGEVIDCLPNCQYKVKLPSGYIIRGYLAGKMKMHKIKVIVGDQVEMITPKVGEIYRIIRRI